MGIFGVSINPSPYSSCLLSGQEEGDCGSPQPHLLCPPAPPPVSPELGWDHPHAKTEDLMARPGGGGRPHTSAWLPPPNIEPGGIELGHVDRDRESHFLSRAQAVRAQVAHLR